MKSICIITNKYPTKYNTSASVFVQQLVCGLADQGINCTVICPIPININVIQGIKLPFKTIEITSKGTKVDVFFPKYIGFGQQDLKIMNTASLTLETFICAVKKVMKIMKEKPDILYGHFITPAGIAAVRIGKEYGIPSFIAYGESSPWSIENIGLNKAVNELETVSGIVAVSTKNKNELVQLGIVESTKVKVIPNAVRTEHFYPRDKNQARKKFGLPLDAFIVAFVGHFIERKGISKVIEAVDNLDDVYAIYAGKGPISPAGTKTFHNGLVDPLDLPWFYSAADIFVLPTQNEGCCNAIIEAMACGLPIVSSDREFNYDILNENIGILVNPDSQADINNAIKKLRDDARYRGYLRDSSLKKVKTLDYNQRIKNIVNWINYIQEKV